MRLLQNIMTKNLAYIENRWIIPRRIVWHSTGANNPYLRRYVGPDDGLLGVNKYKNYWNRPYEEMKRKIAPHGAIGKLADETIATYLLLPIKDGKIMRGHHTDIGKNGNGNDTCIGFEICEDGLNDKAYAMAVYKEACEFTAYLCEQFNLDPLGEDVIIDHARAYQLGIASNRGDVMHWFGRYGITLDKIRRDVWALLEPEPKPPGKVPYTIRLGKGTPYYIQPDNTSKVAGKIEIAGVYTIVEEVGAYGWLKSGAGWVQVKDDPKPEPVPVVPKLVDTWARANTVRQGSKGKHVEVLQALLQMRGYDVQAIDGSFGAVTDRQVRAYQKAQGLTVDGIVGYETWPVILK